MAGYVSPVVRRAALGLGLDIDADAMLADRDIVEAVRERPMQALAALLLKRGGMARIRMLDFEEAAGVAIACRRELETGDVIVRVWKGEENDAR